MRKIIEQDEEVMIVFDLEIRKINVVMEVADIAKLSSKYQ
jgi:hypothetical protein